ncbi:MAG: helix-turn-helix domain-containing protein [Lentisphaeria bacterium]|nr:helix-turn-helix domain-containing protein [Lentisphaeria bacterium]
MNDILWQRSAYRHRHPYAQLKSFINVSSAGHYVTRRGFRDRGGYKPFLEFFWCHRGQGFMEKDGVPIEVSAGDCFVYLPGATHCIYSIEPGWDYYWFTCDGPDMDAVIAAFDLKEELIHAGRCPEELFAMLIEACFKLDIASTIRASVTAYEILMRAFNPLVKNYGNRELSERFQQLVSENFSNPAFSLQEAAALLSVHRSTLHRVFSAHCGIPPQEFLTTYRLQQALELFHSDMNIKEIAENCGFNAPHWFTKIFRRYFGRSPAEFRRMMLDLPLQNTRN